MPAYNFQQRFARAVEIGAKRQTIRRKRKRPTRPGDRLYLYTGMRTKACRLLCKATCRQIEDVVIFSDKILFNDMVITWQKWLEAFAWNDGFHNFEDMTAWFRKTHGLPFSGEVIYW